MKLKKLVFVAIAATAVALPSAYADTPGTAAPTTNKTDAMTALFGDPVIAKGTGVSVKRSDLDQVLTGIKAEYMARGTEIPPDRLTAIEATSTRFISSGWAPRTQNRLWLGRRAVLNRPW